jgi:hypothetical protein
MISSTQAQSFEYFACHLLSQAELPRRTSAGSRLSVSYLFPPGGASQLRQRLAGGGVIKSGSIQHFTG